MAGVISTDQWSIREKLCLASSVIRSGDQNWVSVSRAIKPFGDPARPSDWFSQKNCACQYSALLETVDTPKRKRSERGEVVDTPGDLIVRKMTKERIAELKTKLEEDKAQYQQLQKEIEQIQSGQIDDKLQSMWDEIQEQKRAAEEAMEARKAAAELAKAAAAVKLPSKLAFHSPHKRRPPTRAPRLVSRCQSETSQGDSVEVDEDTSQTPVKTTDESGAVPSDTSVQHDKSASAILTSLAAAKEQEQDALAILEADVPIDTDNDEAAERLLAATASDLVELLSPYPVDSPSSQSLDESSLPSQDTPTSTPVPRVKEPLILKIEKGILKTKEADRNLDLTAAVHSRGVIDKDDFRHTDPSSPDNTLSRDDTEIKVKKKATRGRPPNSQRKSTRRIQAPTGEEDEFSHTDTPPTGRRTAGKDGAASAIASLISEDSKDDTHSEGEESDGLDKPSESDDLSASAGTLQSPYFLESLPNSPASVSHSEEDHAYKIWRKAIMLVWRAVASHKYANIFLHPVTDDIAPGYKSIVLRPINLMTIKKNIESGCIRTTDQFHRDMMLMFQNAIMYNNIDQHVHHIATIMQSDVEKQIEEFVSTQALVQQPDSTKMLRGRGKQGQVEEDRSRRSSTDTDTSGKKRRTRSDEN
ncbi:bromodomain-containing protein 8-like isoform X3 [Asterias rubens]|uniref:bromodomain-containing protein 8-like isoform X3 n=1 Tax=Asterias rubens TaxID=7604 RepID=UPI0014557ED6|nr:bromodomain-containing protein 8-like isoform X3 [Asterias rubens]